MTRVEIEVDGVLRSYELHVPPSYDGRSPSPLVLSFHGFMLGGQAQRQVAGMDPVADERGYLVAYPNGLDNSWNAGVCCGMSAENGVDDVGFARAIIEDLAQRGCIDESRVYAAGFSNGGFLSHRLACEASDVIAAIGPVAGVNGLDSDECNPERAVPVIDFHGTDDSVVLYDGGCALCLSDSESVPDTIAGWTARNGCIGEPEVVVESGSTTCETTGGCDGDASVTLCTTTGGAHCWPGPASCPLGDPADNLTANELMFDLFDRVRLP